VIAPAVKAPAVTAPAVTAFGFYQLMTRSLDDVVPRLLEKVLAAKHRVLLIGDDRAVLARLDVALWSHAPASFLPHALVGEDGSVDEPAAQAVLLATDAVNRNGADVLMCVGGALPDNSSAFARVLLLFDGNDAAALQLARRQWKALGGSGHQLTYWKESGGGWEKAG
jgi:DNA polymerase-3 subunit chi